ncbi:MAG: sulfotransferase family 2 domain-containing protein [Rhodospirillales bacterium]
MIKTESPFILFLHIPKTAGTTLRSVADLQFGRKNVITYYHQKSADTLNNLDYMLRDERHDYRALIGHFRFGVHENLSQPARYVTFLRDPVSLTISAYNERRKTFKAEFEKPDGSMKSIQEHLAENRIAYANLQTKLVAGSPSEATTTEKDLEHAIENLDRHFALAAPTTRFDEALLLLSSRLGWRPCLYGTLNKGPSHEFASPEVRQLIEGLCGLDRRLLEYAARKFETEIEGAGPLFADALADIRRARGDPGFQGLVDANIDAAWFTDLPCLGAYLNANPG